MGTTTLALVGDDQTQLGVTIEIDQGWTTEAEVVLQPCDKASEDRKSQVGWLRTAGLAWCKECREPHRSRA